MARSIGLTMQKYRKAKRGETTCSGCSWGFGYDMLNGRRGLFCATAEGGYGAPCVGAKNTCDKAKPRNTEERN